MRVFVAAIAAVFMYHHVAPSAAHGPWARALTVSPAEFGQQLAWLHSRGCTLVTVSVLVRDAQTARLAPCEVAITFDDGYADAATYAAPMLVADHAVGTFFIATGFVGTSGHVTVAQLRQLDGLGMELGAHTVHHVDLTTVSALRCADEINQSIATLRAWTGTDVLDFAYPAGRYDAAVEAATRAAGIRAAFTTNPGFVGTRALADVLALPRFRVLHGDGLALLRTVIGGRGLSGPAPMPRAEAEAIARERAEGNDMPTAELIGVRLLRNSYPEPIQKVHVLTIPPATVAGIMLSGSGLHVPVTAREFEADARAMAAAALQSAPNVDEVDVWAVVAQPVPSGATVAGDLAIPTDRTVFSLAVRRDGNAERVFIDAAWAASLERNNRAWQN